MIKSVSYFLLQSLGIFRLDCSDDFFEESAKKSAFWIFWFFEGKAEKLLFRQELLEPVFWGKIPGPLNFPKGFQKASQRFAESFRKAYKMFSTTY
jgi:hypothetical protein